MEGAIHRPGKPGHPLVCAAVLGLVAWAATTTTAQQSGPPTGPGADPPTETDGGGLLDDDGALDDAVGDSLQGDSLLPPDDGPRPNILFIMADDLGWGDLGVMGSTDILTPRLDLLASQGARLTQFSCASAGCSPSRAALLAGLYPQELNFYGASDNTTRRGVAEQVLTLPELLAERGYVSAHIGKWHIGEDLGEDTAEFLPPGMGFDHSARLFIPEVQTHWDPLIIRDEETSVLYAGGHSTDALTTETIFMLDRLAQDGRPFFLNLWYYAPHLPMQVPPAWLEAYPDADPEDTWTLYRAMVTHMDACIGQVINYLAVLGLLDDTLIIFTSDNGGALNPGLHPNGNGGLKGGKGQLNEGGLRVPFLARWPGTVPAGLVNDTMMSGLDVLPTLAAAAGVDLPDEGSPEDIWPGQDMLAAFVSPVERHRSQRYFWTGKVGAGYTEPESGILEIFAVREDLAEQGGPDWKLYKQPDDTVVLRDLDADPDESQNLIFANQAKAAELWDAFWAERAVRTRLEYEPQLDGAVKALGPGWNFTGNGVVTLETDARHDVHDGHFSASCRVRVNEHVEQTVLRKPGSWHVWVDAADLVHLAIEGDDGLPLELVAMDPLPAGQGVQVAWTVSRWTSPLWGNTVRLYVDGTLQAQGDVPAIAWNRNPIYVGNDGPLAEATSPFSGILGDLRMNVIALTEEELAGGWPPFPGP